MWIISGPKFRSESLPVTSMDWSEFVRPDETFELVYDSLRSDEDQGGKDALMIVP